MPKVAGSIATSDQVMHEAVTILTNTTQANAPQQLDALARLLLGDRYAAWVRNYRLMHKADWMGG